MKVHTDKIQKNKSNSSVKSVFKNSNNKSYSVEYKDYRPEALVQRKLQEMMSKSTRVGQLKAMQELKTGTSFEKSINTIQRSEKDGTVEDTSSTEESSSDESYEEGEDTDIDGVEVYIEPPGNKHQIRHAKSLIKIIRERYGIELDSSKSLAGMSDSIEENKEEFEDKENEKFLENLSNRMEDSWTIDQLVAVKIGLSRFENLLGAKRLARRDGKQKIPQEIQSFGKVDVDVQGGDTLAETFRSQQNITVFEAGREQGEYPDQSDMTRTIIHELTHGLISHRTEDFKKAVPFWKWNEEEIEKLDSIPGYEMPDYDGETPPNAVAYGNAEEDFAECVSEYLFSYKSRNALKREYPIRYRIVHRILSEELGGNPNPKSKKKGKRQPAKRNKKAYRREMQDKINRGMDDYYRMK